MRRALLGPAGMPIRSGVLTIHSRALFQAELCCRSVAAYIAAVRSGPVATVISLSTVLKARHSAVTARSTGDIWCAFVALWLAAARGGATRHREHGDEAGPDDLSHG